jgi:ABC-2 type transport system ATP-binding protein
VNEQPVVLLDAVGKRFGSVDVLLSLNLEVARGEFLGLVGPNGAGKSTLLRILTGLHQRTSGTCRVFGLDPTQRSLEIRQRCSYLPGETSVYQEMTGARFLQFAQSFHAASDSARERRLADLFALPLHARVRSYSAGMKQKLAVLAALSVEADLYLLDEPDRALDATMRMELRAVLAAMRDQQKTIVLSSHHLEELSALASRLVFLRKGSFIATSEVASARQRLSRRVRLRLADGAQLPTSTRVTQRLGDGSLVIDCEGDPRALLRAIPDAALLAAEVGAERLEDLYSMLFLQPSTPHSEESLA